MTTLKVMANSEDGCLSNKVSLTSYAIGWVPSMYLELVD